MHDVRRLVAQKVLVVADAIKMNISILPPHELFFVESLMGVNLVKKNVKKGVRSLSRVKRFFDAWENGYHCGHVSYMNRFAASMDCHCFHMGACLCDSGNK